MRQLPKGTVTFVFTDIEGSTRLLHTLGDRYRDALAEHRTILRDAFTSHAGVEVDTQGDAFFVAFPTPREALLATIRGQRALAEHPWPPGGELRVRMGIHTGTPEVTEEGYVGSDVHLGARICAAAWGGQILLSPTTAAHVFTSSDDISVRSLGAHALKDIDERIELFQVIGPGLRADFPPPRTTGSHSTNLPPRLQPLIGRDTELAALTELLTRDDVSLVTLVGPGGTGKTRLALATGAELVYSFADGVFFVDLSALTDASLVVPAIAQALSLRETPGRSLKVTLTDHLSHKQLLLIVDNLEQVIDAATDIATLLTGAPGIRVLATSREALRVTGEKELPVPPLSLPSSSDPPEEVVASSAVRLFLARAKDVRPDFQLTPYDASIVAEVCRRLDGLPLAIELAAARVKVLSLPALAERLQQGLKVLTSVRRDASERQRTLRGAIAWSYDLLSQDEQTLFRRLGVFAGGWSLEAAEAVCDRGDLDTEMLDGLASLVDKSLVRTGERRERFSMLETIREFAADELEESGEAEEIRRAHAGFFRQFVEEAEPHLIGPEQKQWLDRLEADLPNLREALRFLLEADTDKALRTSVLLWRLFWIRGHLHEGQVAIETALERLRDGASALRARGLSALGSIAYSQGEAEQAERHASEALRLSKSTDGDAEVLSSLSTLGRLAMDRGDFVVAREYLEEALAVAEQLNSERDIFVGWGNLGALALMEERYEDATELFRWTLEYDERQGDTEGVIVSVGNLGIAAVLGGDAREALAFLRQALVLSADLGHHELIAGSLDGLSAARAILGDLEDAAILLGIAESVRASAGLAREAIEARLYEKTMDLLSTSMSLESSRDMLGRGRGKGLTEGVAYALDALEKPSAGDRYD